MTQAATLYTIYDQGLNIPPTGPTGSVPTQGLCIYWNLFETGTGRSEFINFRGGGSGGFNFYNCNPDDPGFSAPGTLPPIVTFSNTGVVTATSFNATSDYRIKEDIQLLGDKYTVDSLEPKTYYNRLLKKQDIGFIAHEIHKEYPFLVNGEKDTDSYQSLNYQGLIGILVKEVKDLKKRVSELEYKIELKDTQ